MRLHGAGLVGATIANEKKGVSGVRRKNKEEDGGYFGPKFNIMPFRGVMQSSSGIFQKRKLCRGISPNRRNRSDMYLDNPPSKFSTNKHGDFGIGKQNP